MLQDVAYYTIFGKSLVFYSGIVTLLSFLFTTSIAIMNKRGITIVPLKWHPRMVKISITIALIHGLLAMLAYL